MKKIFAAIVLLCLPLIKVEAYYCSYQQQARLKGLASNINTSYDFVEKNNKATFSITLTNLNPDLYIIDMTNNKTYEYTKDEIKINGYSSGQVVKYQVYSNVEFCSNLLYTISVALPSYNPYYKESVCDGLNNYSLCERWTKHNLNKEQFIERVNQYRDSLRGGSTEIETPKEEDAIWDIILEYILKYYYVPLILIIIGCSIGIYVSNKKSNIYS